ncbi:hypothetical protein QCA50_013559 [Cerrena zonata]|uniref:Pectinesterase inhibitor domain-containing protein n=1 Tax=Cerrena zonata TaxID=2478898 RepID=A0AAW0FVD7_9APHY
MTSRAAFRDFEDASIPLRNSLRSIQDHADSSHTLPEYSPLKYCSTILENGILVIFRRDVIHEARVTADYVHRNILSAMVSEGLSTEHKIGKINTFLSSNAFNKKRDTAVTVLNNARNLQNSIRGAEAYLFHLGFNPRSIVNRLDTVMTAIRVCTDMYTQVGELLKEVGSALTQQTFSVENVRYEAQWLSTLSADLISFEAK